MVAACYPLFLRTVFCTSGTVPGRVFSTPPCLLRAVDPPRPCKASRTCSPFLPFLPCWRVLP
ncbi:hypothetical protein BDD12DRAFT_841027 [Trichophaea hybrida]|nr:hypothetical protein BDD12DRAFT_841027 [Trichophaea hybrida]